MPPAKKIKLIRSDKIWDSAPHCALTDLIRFNNRWVCTFRESDQHVHGENGVIRVIESHDGISWQSVAEFREEGRDFRDPKLSITPEGLLMILIGVTHYEDKKYVSRQPRVAFSGDLQNWTALNPILEPHEWLWRVTWHKEKAYGVSYRASNLEKPKEEWIVKLFESDDALHYSLITQWKIPGYPNETTLRFVGDTMVALVRRDRKGDNHAWIGVSEPPYTQWEWKDSGRYFGGPNFIILPDGSMWGAGRLLEETPYGEFEKTALAQMTLDELKPTLILPSGGDDTSYPGMAYHDQKLWISYYSSHEGSTAIYLARVFI